MKGYTRISYEERVKIELLLSQGKKRSEIALTLKRPRSTINREIERNSGSIYRSELAQLNASQGNKIKHKGSKIQKDPLLEYKIILHLKQHWSPEQISKRLRQVYKNNKRFHVSHESIYTYIYLWAKKELRKELISYLRQQKSQRRKPESRGLLRSRIPDRVDISERPPEVESRLIPGHWESDLIIGKDGKSAIGTIVERTTRTTLLVKLKDKTAANVRRAFAEKMLTLPEQMRLSTTHDNGFEMAQHKLFTKETRIKVYFASPYSPWQRGTNENTNMLIRDFFPKGTDFNVIPSGKIQQVQDLLNNRPRKVLNWQTPKEVFENYILKNCR
jgi:transposase, IS30 family